MRLLKNPSKVDIKEFNVNGRLYTLTAGGQDAFKDEVVTALMKVYDFLEEVEIKEEHVKGKSEYKCPECDFRSHAKVAVLGHSRKHGDKEKLIPEEIKTTNEIKLQEGKKAVSEIERKGFGGEQNYVVEDADFYGSGLSKDN